MWSEGHKIFGERKKCYGTQGTWTHTHTDIVLMKPLTMGSLLNLIFSICEMGLNAPLCLYLTDQRSLCWAGLFLVVWDWKGQRMMSFFFQPTLGQASAPTCSASQWGIRQLQWLREQLRVRFRHWKQHHGQRIQWGASCGNSRGGWSGKCPNHDLPVLPVTKAVP